MVRLCLLPHPEQNPNDTIAHQTIRRTQEHAIKSTGETETDSAPETCDEQCPQNVSPFNHSSHALAFLRK